MKVDPDPAHSLLPQSLIGELAEPGVVVAPRNIHDWGGGDWMKAQNWQQPLTGPERESWMEGTRFDLDQIRNTAAGKKLLGLLGKQLSLPNVDFGAQDPFAHVDQNRLETPYEKPVNVILAPSDVGREARAVGSLPGEGRPTFVRYPQGSTFGSRDASGKSIATPTSVGIFHEFTHAVRFNIGAALSAPVNVEYSVIQPKSGAKEKHATNEEELFAHGDPDVVKAANSLVRNDAGKIRMFPKKPDNAKVERLYGKISISYAEYGPADDVQEFTLDDRGRYIGQFPNEPQSRPFTLEELDTWAEPRIDPKISSPSLENPHVRHSYKVAQDMLKRLEDWKDKTSHAIGAEQFDKKYKAEFDRVHAQVAEAVSARGELLGDPSLNEVTFAQQIGVPVRSFYTYFVDEWYHKSSGLSPGFGSYGRYRFAPGAKPQDLTGADYADPKHSTKLLYEKFGGLAEDIIEQAISKWPSLRSHVKELKRLQEIRQPGESSAQYTARFFDTVLDIDKKVKSAGRDELSWIPLWERTKKAAEEFKKIGASGGAAGPTDVGSAVFSALNLVYTEGDLDFLDSYDQLSHSQVPKGPAPRAAAKGVAPQPKKLAELDGGKVERGAKSVADTLRGHGALQSLVKRQRADVKGGPVRATRQQIDDAISSAQKAHAGVDAAMKHLGRAQALGSFAFDVAQEEPLRAGADVTSLIPRLGGGLATALGLVDGIYHDDPESIAVNAIGLGAFIVAQAIPVVGEIVDLGLAAYQLVETLKSLFGPSSDGPPGPVPHTHLGPELNLGDGETARRIEPNSAWTNQSTKEQFQQFGSDLLHATANAANTLASRP